MININKILELLYQELLEGNIMFNHDDVEI